MNWSESDYANFLASRLPAQFSTRERKPKDDPTPERELQARIRSLALTSGWLCYHTHDSRRSDPGFPDVVLCRPGSLIFAELKTATGKLSKEQSVWLALLGQSIPRLEVYVWRPADWAEIQERLTRTKGGTPHG